MIPMDKSVLVIKTDILLSRDTMARLYEQFVEQVKTGVVIIPPYFEAEILQVPENVEVRIEAPDIKESEFLVKGFNLPDAK